MSTELNKMAELNFDEDIAMEDLDHHSHWLNEEEKEAMKDLRSMKYLQYIYKTYNPEKYKKLKEGLKAAGIKQDEDSEEILDEWKRDFDASNKKRDDERNAASSSGRVENTNEKRHEENGDDLFEEVLPIGDEVESDIMVNVDTGDIPMCRTDNFFEEAAMNVNASSEAEETVESNSTYMPSLIQKMDNIGIEQVEIGDDAEVLCENDARTKETTRELDGTDDEDSDSDNSKQDEDEEVYNAIHGPPSAMEFKLPLDRMGTYRVPPIRTDADRFLEMYIQQMKKQEESGAEEGDSDRPSVFYNDYFKNRNNEVIIEGEEDNSDDENTGLEVLEEDIEPSDGRISAILNAMKSKPSSTKSRDSSENLGRGERSFTTVVDMVHEDGEALPL